MKVAIIGANGNFGLKRLRSILPGGDEVIALCDPNLENALKLHNPRGLIKATDYRQLGDITADMVVISTPDYAKLPIVEFFLNAGKHVLVEKPFALRTAEVRRLYSMARQKGVCLHVGYNLRFFPSVAKLLELAGGEYFGNVHYLRMYYGHGGIHAKLRKNQDWQLDGELSWGGSFVDMGVHLLSLAAQFVSCIDDGKLELQYVFSPTVEDHCTGILRCGDCLIELTSSWTTWRSRFSLEIYGTEGFAESESLVKYIKYGQGGEHLRYGRSNPGGVPDATELLFTLPGMGAPGATEVTPFSAEVEYLDKEWAWLTRSINEGTFDLEYEEAVNLFIAEVFERFYYDKKNT